MKKQNVNGKLAFKKAAVAELNDNQLIEVNGGSTITVTTIPLSVSVVSAITVSLAYSIHTVFSKEK